MKKKINGRPITHGFARRNIKRPREYNCWMHMIGRCYNPNHAKYKYYGAKGIGVCDRWRKFANFFEDMGKSPSDTHSLDRYPNQKGNYEPGNVRWATPTEQARNMASNRILEFNGLRLCLSEWAEKLGIGKTILNYRLKQDWPLADVFSKTVRSYGKIDAAIKTTVVELRASGLTYRKIAEACGISLPGAYKICNPEINSIIK